MTTATLHDIADARNKLAHKGWTWFDDAIEAGMDQDEIDRRYQIAKDYETTLYGDCTCTPVHDTCPTCTAYLNLPNPLPF